VAAVAARAATDAPKAKARHAPPVRKESAGLQAQLLLVGAQGHTALAACRLSAASTTVWFPQTGCCKGSDCLLGCGGAPSGFPSTAAGVTTLDCASAGGGDGLFASRCYTLSLPCPTALDHVQACHGRGHRVETCLAHPTKPQVNGLAPGRLRRSETHHGPTGPGRGHSSSPSGRS
jgi:hypothetical protein